MSNYSNSGSGNLNITISATAPFTPRAPKPAGINTVKLTEDNLKLTGAHILKARGGGVTVGDDHIGIGELVRSPVDGAEICYEDALLKVGAWVVEEWDYREERAIYRTASLTEREKYDLR